MPYSSSIPAADRSFRTRVSRPGALRGGIPLMLLILCSTLPLAGETIPLWLYMEGSREFEVVTEFLEEAPDDPFIEALPLIGALEGKIREPVLAAVRGLVQENGFLRFMALEGTGLRPEFRFDTLFLSLKIPPELRETVVIRLAAGSGPAGNVVPEEAAPVSAALNIRSRAETGRIAEPGLTTDSVQAAVDLDGALNLRNWVLESAGSLTWQDNFSAEHRFTRLVHDLPDSGIRLMLGGLSYRIQGFQSAPGLLGLGFAHESALVTGREYAPFGEATVFLKEPSTVSLVMNNKGIRTLTLPAGSYVIRDLAWEQGINSIDLLVTDSSGTAVQESWMFPFDSRLLAPGASDFSFMLGMPESSLKAPDWNNVNGIFFYNRGFLETLTGGLNVQADGNRQVAGSRLLYSTRAGTFGLDAAVSHTRGAGFGSAALLGYSLSPRTLRYPLNLGLAASLSSSGFRPTGNGTGFPSMEFSGSYLQSLPSGLSLGTSVRLPVTGESGTANPEFSFTLNKSIQKTSSLSFHLRYKPEATEESVWQGTVSFSVTPFSSPYSLGTTHTLEKGISHVEIRKRAEKQVNDYSLTLGLTGSPEQEQVLRNLSLSGSYSRYRFDTAFSGSLELPSGSGLWNFRGNTRLDTALVFAGGVFSLSRPVNDGFVIATHGRQGSPVGLNPVADGYSALGEALPAVLPSIRSYTVTRIIAETPGADILQGMSPTTFYVRPGYRGGILLRLKNTIPVHASGRLLLADGSPAVFLAGEAARLPDGTTQKMQEQVPFFTDEDGRFEIQDLSSGTYTLIMYDLPDSTLELSIPEGFEGGFDAGTRTLQKIADGGNP